MKSKALVLILERRTDGASACSNKSWPVDGGRCLRIIVLSAPGSGAAENASADTDLETQFKFNIDCFIHFFYSIVFISFFTFIKQFDFSYFNSLDDSDCCWNHIRLCGKL